MTYDSVFDQGESQAQAALMTKCLSDLAFHTAAIDHLGDPVAAVKAGIDARFEVAQVYVLARYRSDVTRCEAVRARRRASREA